LDNAWDFLGIAMSSLLIAEFSLLLFALWFLSYGLLKMRQPFEAQLLANTSSESRSSSLNQFNPRKNNGNEPF